MLTRVINKTKISTDHLAFTDLRTSAYKIKLSNPKENLDSFINHMINESCNYLGTFLN